MKMKLLNITLLIFAFNTLWAQTLRQEQFASSVIAFSSEYIASPGTFSTAKLLGKPEFYPLCGSNGNCWAPATKNGSREFFVLGFATPQPVNTIRIYQSWGPEAVDTVYVRNASNGVWSQVYQTTVVNGPSCPGTVKQLLEITIPSTGYNVDAVRVAIASNIHLEWNEFDAVSIANFDQMAYNYIQYASSVIGFSSEYNPSPQNYSAEKLRGIPDAGTPTSACGSNSNSWAPATENGQREFFELGFSMPSFVNRIMIHRTFTPGGIDTVYLKEFGTNTWHKVWEHTAAPEPYCVSSKYLEINFTKTSYIVSAVRVAINSPAVSGWHEIDAVGIRSELPPNTFLTAQDGNWSNPATWIDGVVPGPADKVAIVPTHDVVVDANGAARTLSILPGSNTATNGSLTINNAATTLTIGDFNTGGGKDSVVVKGTLNISNGALNIGGRLLQYLSPAGINHTGGIMRIDGNTGIAATSVADADYLLHSLPTGSANYSFTGGQLIFIDPPIGPSGNTMYWSTSGGISLGANSEIVLGDGISTTSGGSGYKLLATACGNIVVNNPSGSNRALTNFCGQIQNLTITSGSFNTTTSLNIIGTTVNNGTLSCTASALDMRGGCTNTGTLTASNDLFANDNVTNNTGASITAPKFYFTRNLSNNGSISVSTTFSCSRTITTNSTYAQVISGTGTFNLSNATFRIANSNASGVTLNTNLTVSKLTHTEGKFYLGPITLHILN